jgi:ABC-type branched-subunit amino acid transport system substrate-binding protein
MAKIVRRGARGDSADYSSDHWGIRATLEAGMNRHHIRIAAGGALLVLAAAACGGSSGGGGSSATNTPGVTSTTITIGSTQPLTGLAAPGYSEIAPAAKAMFDSINAAGGINGRKIVYKYVDDGYNPTNTVTQTQKLILQDKVFAIFNALGTPTHQKVVDFLNQNKVPDLFVASGCLCWNQPTQHPYTFGYQTDYTVEGKILGNYLKSKFAGKKIAYFYQADDFGQNGVKGLDMELPSSQIVSRQSYQPTNINVSTQVAKLAASKADVVVSFSVPAFTALLKLNMLKAGYNPQLVVSNVGSDPLTLSGLLEAYAKAGGATVKGSQLIQGIITDAYLSSPADPTNSWIQLFKKVHDQYDAKAPFDGNVLFGMASAWTFAEAVLKAGKNLTRAGVVSAVEGGLPQGAGLVPFQFSAQSHAGLGGVQIGVIQGTTVKLQGQPMTTGDGTEAVTASTEQQTPAPASGIPSG